VGYPHDYGKTTIWDQTLFFLCAVRVKYHLLSEKIGILRRLAPLLRMCLLWKMRKIQSNALTRIQFMLFRNSKHNSKSGVYTVRIHCNMCLYVEAFHAARQDQFGWILHIKLYQTLSFKLKRQCFFLWSLAARHDTQSFPQLDFDAHPSWQVLSTWLMYVYIYIHTCTATPRKIEKYIPKTKEHFYIFGDYPVYIYMYLFIYTHIGFKS